MIKAVIYYNEKDDYFTKLDDTLNIIRVMYKDKIELIINHKKYKNKKHRVYINGEFINHCNEDKLETYISIYRKDIEYIKGANMKIDKLIDELEEYKNRGASYVLIDKGFFDINKEITDIEVDEMTKTAYLNMGDIWICDAINIIKLLKKTNEKIII